jgi:D-tyrosyl-tRNA(Tyr) deacylase
VLHRYSAIQREGQGFRSYQNKNVENYSTAVNMPSKHFWIDPVMRAVIQRVEYAGVSVNGGIIGEIGPGLLLYLGVAKNDDEKDARLLSDKAVNLRIFEDRKGKMNRSLLDISGDILVISQFTLLADCRKGRRPSFIDACDPLKASALYDRFIELLKEKIRRVAAGKFQAQMIVTSANDGPVTLILDTKKSSR